MEWIAPIVCTAVFLLSAWIQRSNRKEQEKAVGKSQVTVCLPRAFLVVGGIDTAFFGGVLIAEKYLSAGESPELLAAAAVLFSAFMLLGVWIIAACILWKIQIDRESDSFRLTTSFGHTYDFSYSEILDYRITLQGDCKVRTKRKTFQVDSKAVNAPVFAEMLQKHGVPRKN